MYQVGSLTEIERSNYPEFTLTELKQMQEPGQRF